MNASLDLIFNLPNLLTLSLGAIATVLAYVYAKKRQSPQLRSYVPSVWTSLGIFFTFICICDGLYKTQGDLDITVVIDKIVPAFTTSIIGIFFAIIFSSIDKFKRSKSDSADCQTLEHFANKTLTNNIVDNPDIILLGLIREISDSLKESNMQLSESNKQLNELKAQNISHKNEVVKKVHDSFTEQKTNFDAALNTLSQSFSNAIEESSTEHKSQVEGMLNNFNTESEKRETLHQTKINEMIKQNTDTIELVSEKFKDATNKLVEESVAREKSITQYIGNGTESFKNYIEGQNQKIDAIVGSLKNSLDAFIIDTRNLFNEEIQKTISIFADEQRNGCSNIIKEQQTKLVVAAEDALGTLSESLNGMSNNVLTSVKNLEDSIRETLNSLHEEGTRRTKDLLDKNIEQYNYITSGVSDLCKQVTEDVGKSYIDFKTFIKDTDEKTINKIDEVGKGVIEDINKAYLEFEGIFKQLCSDSRQFITTSAGEQKKEIDGFVKSYEGNLTSIADTINNNNIKIGSELKELHVRITSATEKVGKEYETIAGTFADKMDALGKAIQKATEKDIESYNQLKAQITSSSEHLVKSVAKEVKESMKIEELKAACSLLAEKISTTIVSFDEYAKSTQISLEEVVESLKSYSNIAEATELLCKYINTTINLYKEHSNTNASIKNDITSVVSEVKKVASDMQGVASSLKEASDSVSVIAKHLPAEISKSANQ